jgi:hypothetical protein
VERERGEEEDIGQWASIWYEVKGLERGADMIKIILAALAVIELHEDGSHEGYSTVFQSCLQLNKKQLFAEVVPRGQSRIAPRRDLRLLYL